ncbi:hypothetical protein H0H81_008692 [Sphagnurus paluster]|uniref:Uncharacterized protein n=1 Tax=Sphagnurus paluster TaxID=117069 RepID=A0A9P7K6K3_9AGAR|nr:hypothetical protein H0H81_008692 [Sphagnurus paluster]
MASDSSLAASTVKIPQILTDALETTPLLRQDDDIGLICKSEEGVSATTMFWQEMKTIPQYALPVFGYVTMTLGILDFSMVFVPVISIGHMSTTSLAAISLGSMTANVTGLSVLQGLASALDTLLPSAYTSPQPHLVGLWAQRMERILLGLRQDPEVAHLAAIYLRWFLFGLPGS